MIVHIEYNAVAIFQNEKITGLPKVQYKNCLLFKEVNSPFFDI
jgi:hypothetical protein